MTRNGYNTRGWFWRLWCRECQAARVRASTLGKTPLEYISSLDECKKGEHWWEDGAIPGEPFKCLVCGSSLVYFVGDTSDRSVRD